MAKSYALKVAPREEKGSRAVRRLRIAGFVPVVLYGHGEANVPLKVTEDELHKAMHSHSNVFEMEIGGKTDSALIHDVQLDPLGDYVLHVDFLRVSLTESVEVQVPLRLHGEAKGVTEDGGILNQLIHEIEIACLPTDIPEEIVVEVGQMAADDQITVADLVLDPSIKLLTPADEIVVLVQPPRAEEEAEAEEGAEELTSSEPEVIGRKAAEEEGEE